MIKAIALFMFLCGIFIFGMSFHNIDLSVNMKAGGIDVNAVGYVQDALTMYLNGMTGMGFSIVLMIGGFTALYQSKEVKA